jgi:PIN domain nuclease of toxin-antitoxin system
VRLLLDSHVLIWWLADDPRLRTEARAAVASDDSFVAVSAATAWELSIKIAAGKLKVPGNLELQLAQTGFSYLPVTVEHGFLAGSLPPHHADPFDRMLVAQAQLEGLTLVTRDPRIAAYGVATLQA